MNYTIRKANVSDSKILSDLGAVTFYDTFSPYHTEEDMQLYLNKAYQPDLIKQNINNSKIAYFILSDGEKNIGYTKLLLDAEHSLLYGRLIELEKIYVLKKYLDKKAGAALMNHAISYATECGFETLFLGVWQENHRAVSFYKRYGFETFTTRTFQLGSRLCDDFLMKKNLK